MTKIGIAIESSGKDEEMLAKTTYLKAKGLIEFNQYTKAVDSIDEALKYNKGTKSFELRKLKGTAKAFLGRVEVAISIYKELLEETDDNVETARVCINLAWAYITLDKENHDKGSLEEGKKYLDIANQYFDSLSNVLKRKILNNFSVYYYYLEDYEKSIKVLNEALEYAEEHELPKLYNNLAEVLIESDKDNLYEDIEPAPIREYLDKSEVLASKYNDKIELGFSFFARAKLEVLEEKIYTALDSLYVAFTFFTEAEAYAYSVKCLLKINEIINECKTDCMKSLEEKLQDRIKSNPYYEEKFKKQGGYHEKTY